MLIAILVTVMLIVIITTIQQLYETAFQHASERLTETVGSQAQLIESITFSALEGKAKPYSAETEATALALLLNTYKDHRGFGDTGEFALAKQINGNIEFLLGHLHTSPDNIHNQTRLYQYENVAIPMQLALAGKSGTLVTEDYRGVQVLAAYQPIKLLNYGIVAKIDLAEFRKPFIRASVISISIGVILIFIGAIGFHLITTPLLNRIHRSEYRMRLLLNSTADGVFGINIAGHCTFTNIAGLKLFGYSEKKLLLGKPLVEVLKQPELSGVYADDTSVQTILKAFQATQKDLHYEIPLSDQSDRNFIAEIRLSPIVKDDRCIGAVILIADITQQREAQAQKLLARTVYENIEEGIIVTNANTEIVSVNSAFQQITGYQQEEVLGRNPRFLKSGQQDQSFYASMWQQIIKEGCWKGVIWNKKKSGEIIPLWSSISSVKNPAGKITHFVGAISDISALKAKEEMLEHMAHHDPLTGLPNRLLLDARFELSLQNSARRNSKLAVLFIDLDYFKEINDQYGHKAGDQLLIETAQRLRKLLREEDTVSRLGGDEFVILLPDINNTTSALELAEKIKQSIKRNFTTEDGLTLKVDSSIGIALYPDHGRDTSSLLSRADHAMYIAKKKGKNCISFFQYDNTDETD
ncbi:diguanylate cyclase domain-containing protein [Amphritea japonica]|uniref:Signal transduction protein n=2 Tax=Amphritea TaxID=515417 RepID=A0A7R6PMI2_9GAMM|nr:diguanylate cyclase [Amphritea japonica]BBB27035.1 signal transduction protein [Amphritea japonica ATCC BAA-1530]